MRDAPNIRLNWPNADALDVTGIEAARELVNNLVGCLQAIGNSALHDLRGIDAESWSFGWQRQVEEALSETQAALIATREALPVLAAFVGNERATLSWNVLAVLDALSEVLPHTPTVWPPVAETTIWIRAHDEINRWTTAAKAHLDTQHELANRWRLELVPSELEPLRQALRDAENSRLLPAPAERLPPIADRSCWIHAQSEIARWTDATRAHLDNQLARAKRWHLEMLPSMLEPLRQQLHEADQSGFFRAWWKRRNVRIAFRESAITPIPRKAFELNAEIDRLLAYQAEAKRLATSAVDVRAALANTVTIGLQDWRMLLATEAWALPAWRKQRAVRLVLKSSAIAPMPSNPVELSGEVDQLHTMHTEERRLAAAVLCASYGLADVTKINLKDWRTFQAAEVWACRVQTLVTEYCGTDFGSVLDVRKRWLDAARVGRSLFATGGKLNAGLSTLHSAIARFSGARETLRGLLQIRSGAWCEDDIINVIVLMETDLIRWRGHVQNLRSWCAWRAACAKALALNLGPLVAAIENQSLAADDLPRAFDAGYWRWWAEAVIDSEPALREFSGREHARRIVSFRETDTQHRELTPQVIRARLAARVPSARDADRETQKEFDLLAHEAGKQRRHLAVRQLVQRLPKTISRLAPCMLVSPISAAQYLDTGAFDIVIFDEASQIPIWDAVGAMARGKQVIVVGDPKQLPPTSFFSRTEAGDDEVEVEDLESMLDDCIAARVPWLTLDWHYRSRHESLITFSNRQYYGGRLLTFPSADTAATGVQHRQVAGIYERSGSRTNPIEARAVVDEILRRLGDPVKSGESIGVVTFSQAQ